MQKMIMLLVLAATTGCVAGLRNDNGTYSGYSCRESYAHHFSQCGEIPGKKDFDAIVEKCEKDLSTGVCVEPRGDLLWCMGRTAKGQFLKVGVGMVDGCDCSYYEGKTKECELLKK